jgi:hypothetical protein
MGLERLIRSRLGGMLLVSVVGYAAIPPATAHSAASAMTTKTKTCGQGGACTLSLSSTPTPPSAGAPGGSRPGGGGGGGGSESPAFSTISVDTHADNGRIESGSQLVGARDAGHRLVCRGYTRRDNSWFEFMLTSKKRFGITYEITDAIHNTTREGVHICAGLGYKFTTLSGDPARRATLPDGTKGYVGLLPLCKETADGTVLSKGPCISFLVQATGSDGPATFVGVQIPATSQSDPWMGG